MTVDPKIARLNAAMDLLGISEGNRVLPLKEGGISLANFCDAVSIILLKLAEESPYPQLEVFNDSQKEINP